MSLFNIKLNNYEMPLWQLIIFSILIILVVSFLIRVMFINQRTFGLTLTLLIFELAMIPLVIFIIKDKKNTNPDFNKYAALILLIIMVVLVPLIVFSLMMPELRKHLDAKSASHLLKSRSHNSEGPSSKNKEIIAEAIFELSSKKIGALITIEKYNSLEHFAERAITINADISKELIHNIFIPNTPLHDGAVIVRDDKIICAGAYFNLTKNLSYEKTTGSRHRAALGVSEVSDSLTIVASEETGDVSVAYGGVLIPISDKNALVNYLESFVK